MVRNRRPGGLSHRVHRLILVAALATVAVAAACAPKRVVRRTPSHPAPPPATGPAAASSHGAETTPAPEGPVAAGDLPAPEPRGLAGTGMPERTPGSVTFGAEAAVLAGAQLGKPYQWGASGPDRFDCSGLVQHVYGQLGVALPRVSEEQARVGRAVGRSELQAGDLVFFATRGRGIDHVGIYVGEDEFIHAPNRGTPVCTESLAHGWWRTKYATARRIR